jgi:hypothetical protein
MLYKFKSRAAGDVIMLEPNGRQILEIIGKGDSLVKGILLPADMPAALSALEAAVQQEAQALEEKAREAQATGEPEGGATTSERQDAKNEAVLLRQRAAPFITMVQRSHAADKEIVWGV